MKSCFEELHTFLSMRGDISSSEVRTQEGEFERIGKQLRDFTVKEITFFDGNFCWYQFVHDWPFCVLLSLGEMFTKRAQIQSDWNLEFRNVLSQAVPRCANGTFFAFKHKLTDVWIKVFKKGFVVQFYGFFFFSFFFLHSLHGWKAILCKQNKTWIL